MPLPSAETTPPVTKMKRVCGRLRASTSLGTPSRTRPCAAEAPRRRELRPRRAAPPRACGRRSSEASAPSIRQSSSTTPSPSQRLDRGRARARRRPTSRSGSGRLASAAICGRWVMQSTWRARPSARSRSPTARAVWPPTPASTSSNTSVRDSPAPATVISASITRESSPPEAVSRSGAAGTPGLGASMNSTRSAPVGRRAPRAARARPRTRRPPSRARPAPPRTRSASRGAASPRAAVTLGRQRGRARRAPRPAPPRPARSPPPAFSSSVALRAAALRVRQHRRHAAAVLALEPVVEVEPLLDLLEPAGLGLERRRRSGAARRRGPPPRSAARASRSRARRAPGPRPATPSASRSASASSAATPASPLSGAIASAPAPAAATQRVEPAQPLALGRQRGLLLLGRARAPRSPRSRSAAGRGRGRGCPRARAAPPARASSSRARAWAAASSSRSSSCSRAAEAVEQLELGRGEREPPVLVLAEEGDAAARRARAGRPPMAERPCTKRAGAPLRAHAPGEHDLVERLGRSARAGRRARDRRAARAAARTRPPRRPRGRPAGRSRCAACRPAAGRARARARSCPRPVSPVIALRPGPGPQLRPLDQQQVLDSQLEEHRAQVLRSGRRRSAAAGVRRSVRRAGRTCRAGGGRSSRPGSCASSAASCSKRIGDRSPRARACRRVRPSVVTSTGLARRAVHHLEHVVGRHHERPRGERVRRDERDHVALHSPGQHRARRWRGCSRSSPAGVATTSPSQRTSPSSSPSTE